MTFRLPASSSCLIIALLCLGGLWLARVAHAGSEISVLGERGPVAGLDLPRHPFPGDMDRQAAVCVLGPDRVAVATAASDADWLGLHDLRDGESRRLDPELGPNARGLRVACADTDGDGTDEIIVGAAAGGTMVQLLDASGNVRHTAGFAAFPGHDGGVNLAAGDLDGDGTDEIVAGSGQGMLPMVRAYDRYGLQRAVPVEREPMDLGRSGLAVAVANGGVVSAARFQSIPQLWIFGRTGRLAQAFSAYGGHYRGGVNLASADLDGDGLAEIIAAPGHGGGGHVRVFDARGALLAEHFLPHDELGTGLAAGDLDGDGRAELLAWQQYELLPPQATSKSILIDISQQRLYAREGGSDVAWYDVSTGVEEFPTPTGEFDIAKMAESATMSWEFGPADPRNYDLPDVPWVMTFLGPYAIHGTYWHDDFGEPRSHGCVNLSVEDARRLYAWASLEVPVTIRY